jgi:hypothetical protein
MNRYCFTLLGYKSGNRLAPVAASVECVWESDERANEGVGQVASAVGFEEVIDYGIKRLEVYHRPHVSPKTATADGQEVQIVSLGEWVAVRDWRDPRNHDTALSLLEQEAQHAP